MGAALLVASMGLCFLYSLVDDGACPVMYTKDSGKSPLVWFIILSSLLSLACCFIWCLFAPDQQQRRRSREDDQDGPVTIALVSAPPHAD